MKIISKENRPKLIMAIPLIGVNSIAMYGQYAFFRDHSSWPIFAAIGIAVTIESISVYLAYAAHVAMLALDTSLRLRLSAYMSGIIAGFLNLSHYSPDWHITVIGIATGILSASSPFLWGIYSRRQSRNLMAEKGLIEPGAVRLGNRWLVHPLWCVPVFRYAIWNGIRNPSDAIEQYRESQIAEPAMPALLAAPEPPEPATAEPEPATADPEPALPAEPARAPRARTARARRTLAGSKAERVRQALSNAPGDDAPTIAARLADLGVTVSPAYVRNVKSVSARREIAARRGTMRALASGASSNDAADNRIQDE